MSNFQKKIEQTKKLDKIKIGMHIKRILFICRDLYDINNMANKIWKLANRRIVHGFNTCEKEPRI